MKTQVYFGIAIRIILLFSVAMIGTYLPEILRDFFGDTPCVPDANGRGCRNGFGVYDYDWGVRHYWYWWGMFLLFILSLVNCVLSIIGLLDKHYPNAFK